MDDFSENIKMLNKRWIDIKEAWLNRIRYMARFIRPNKTVVDLGAGLELLYNYLPTGCKYTPCDVTKRSERTHLCNFNEGLYPRIKEHDYIFISGVLEYIEDPEEFFMRMPSYGRRIIMSYSTIDKNNSHRHPDWVNQLSLKKIIELLNKNNYSVVFITEFGWYENIICAEIEKSKHKLMVKKVLYYFRNLYKNIEVKLVNDNK